MKKLVYEDVAPEAKEAFQQSAIGVEDYSTPPLLQSDALTLPYYFNPCEPYTYLLDGNREIIPDTLDGLYAIISTVADDNGNITTVQTAQADEQYQSQGISLTFDDIGGIYPNDLNIAWYQGNTLLSEKDFQPNSTTYFCQNLVTGYDKLVITYSHINMPNVRMQIRGIEFGVTRTYVDSEIPEVSMIQEVYPVNLGDSGGTPLISANTTDFSIRVSDDDLSLIFQKKQVLKMYFDDVLQSTTMVDTAKRTGATTYEVESSDYVGAVLDKVYFVGGMYDGTVTARSVLESISAQTLVPFDIDSSIDDMLLGYIPYTTCRTALAYICFAIGAVVNTANSDTVRIYPMTDNVISTIPTDLVFSESVEDIDKLTSFELTSYSYKKSSEVMTAYEDDDVGSGIFVTFSEPLYNLSITNGTITASGANYAIITAQSGCVLMGNKYTAITSVTTVTNPDKLASDLENVISSTVCTLINKNNVYTIAQLCYNYYSRGTKFNGDIAILNNETPGDTVIQKTRYSGDITGVIIEKRYSINSSKIVAEVTVR